MCIRDRRKYDPAMLEKPRWLVLNKADLMFEDEAKAAAEAVSYTHLDVYKRQQHYTEIQITGINA